MNNTNYINKLKQILQYRFIQRNGSITMGLTQSLQSIQTFYLYNSLVQKQVRHFYFGPQLQIYKSKFNPKQQFTKHTIQFHEIQQMHNFIREVKSLIESRNNLLPFNILYPVNVFLKEDRSFVNSLPVRCDEIGNEVVVVHKWLGRSLEEVVKEKRKGFNQESIWFVINQLSKSLEILQQKNHASHFLMPESIFCNQNDNWLLYDGYFVVGIEGISHFYQNKLKQKQFISEDFRRKIDSSSIISNNQAIQQDIYCLGYCIIFMMTTIHPREMPLKPTERESYVQKLLQVLTETLFSSNASQRLKRLENNSQFSKFSSELINLVKNLIKPDPKRRFTIKHIRSYLKGKQQQIFMNQEEQWSGTTISKTQLRRTEQKQLKTGSKASQYKKINRAKSSLLPQHNMHLQQNSQHHGYDKNLTSIRTLKKQSIPQKIVLMNNRHLASNPFAINQHHDSYKNDHLSQVTPNRKIGDGNLNRLRIKSIEEKCNGQVQKNQKGLGSSSNIRQMNSPGRGQNQGVFLSPDRGQKNGLTLQSSPLNNNLAVNRYQSPTNQHFSQRNHANMNSPSHVMTVPSPLKVRLQYLSPQRSRV